MDATAQRSLLSALLPAVLAAGRIEMSYFAGGVEVERKADASPVTAADHEAEAVLVAALSAAAPGVPIIAEELAAAGRMPAVSREFFLVDPLDGTREFIKGVPEFTVNIGLVRDGTPVFGLIYAPASALLFATVGPHEAVEARVLPAAAVSSLSGLDLVPIAARRPDRARLVALDSRSHASERTRAYLDRLGVAERRGVGSSLKFCLIARGEADVYARFGDTSEWDTAAGHAILAAAGGTVVVADGSPLRYGKADRRYLNTDFFAWGAGGPLV